MSIQTATPYLILGGKAREAIALYERAFGATTQNVQRFGDVDASCPAARRDFVMHAELRLDGATLMLSDGAAEAAATSAPAPAGDAKISVAIGADEEASARRAFDALAEHGTIIQPLFAAPWGGIFGVVHDQFGVSWMFNIVTK